MSRGPVLLWFMRYRTRTVEEFDTVEEAFGYADHMTWEGSGSPYALESADGRDQVLTGEAFAEAFDAWRTEHDRALFPAAPAPPVVGELQLQDPSGAWVTYAPYTDPDRLTEDRERLSTTWGRKRVAVKS